VKARFPTETPTRKPLPHEAVLCNSTRDHDPHHTDPKVLQETILEAMTYNDPDDLGAFLYMVLRGSCIWAAMKNFELIMSVPVDLGLNQPQENSPLSMTCEANPSAGRAFMVETLLKHGSAIGRGVIAGVDHSFVLLLVKPHRIGGMGPETIVGVAVNESDKGLVRQLIELGDMIEYNEDFQKQATDAASQGLDTLTFQTYPQYGMTELIIPPSITTWAVTTLQHLDLSRNSLTTLPDSFYDLVELRSLNLSANCLFALSHRIKNFSQLVSLQLGNNLLEALPEEIVSPVVQCNAEKKKNISTFTLLDC